MLAVTANCHSEFDELGDVTHLVAGSICVIDWDRDCGLAGVELVLLYIGAVDSAAGTPAVQEGTGCQGLGSHAGV